MSPIGILDTNTLLLLGRITTVEALPDEALITAVTLAELSVGPLVANTDEERVARAKRIYKRPRPISNHCRSTPPRHAPSVAWLRRFAAPVVSPLPVPTTP